MVVLNTHRFGGTAIPVSPREGTEMTQLTSERDTTPDGAVEFRLTAGDRCDSCGAQAYVRVTLATGELLFCAHHARKHEDKLKPLADSWHDESHRLSAK